MTTIRYYLIDAVPLSPIPRGLNQIHRTLVSTFELLLQKAARNTKLNCNLSRRVWLCIFITHYTLHITLHITHANAYGEGLNRRHRPPAHIYSASIVCKVEQWIHRNCWKIVRTTWGSNFDHFDSRSALVRMYKIRFKWKLKLSFVYEFQCFWIRIKQLAHM